MKRHLPTLFLTLLILVASTVIDANAQAKAGSAEAHVAAAKAAAYKPARISHGSSIRTANNPNHHARRQLDLLRRPHLPSRQLREFRRSRNGFRSLPRYSTTSIMLGVNSSRCGW